MRIIVVLAASLAASPVLAQSFSGPARAVDGDTLVMGGERIRLFGIDAPESMQSCTRGASSWACGEDAKSLLAQMVAGRAVTCAARDRDSYGRTVATCHAGSSDLSSVMVREGLAVSLPQFSTDYLALETRAKQLKLALWGSTFEMPAEFRRANPGLFASAVSRPTIRTAPRSSKPRQLAMAASNWSFRNCREARASGAAPLYRGQPGYGAHMDGDGDGIACEPYRR